MPTIRRCCIVGCLSNSRQNPQLQFFQFPRPENPFHKLWKQACQASLSRILPFKKPVVCALHFRPNCIGGRRLTSSAVPSLRLEVPSNLKAVEQQAMIEDIERSRKCAYINAVVYEWLVRANLNPQLRGSITHGMIKEKAESARQIIGSTSFVADNRWLNRFRETHLGGFAQRLANNQLKPVGSSLWIPDIAQDLHHMFPVTSADRLNLENLPEQYYDYMQQQYGEYEEEDDGDQRSNGSFSDQGSMSNHYIQQDQRQQQNSAQQQQQAHGYGGYDAYGQMQYGGGYDDYYYQQDRQQYQQQPQQSHSYQHTPPPSAMHSSSNTPTLDAMQQQSQPPTRPSSHSPQQQPANSPPLTRVTPKPSESPVSSHSAAKRPRYDEYDQTDEQPPIDGSTDETDEQKNGNQSDTSRRSSSSHSTDNEVAAANEGHENGNSNSNDNDNDDNENDDNDNNTSSPTLSLGRNGHMIRPIQLPKAPLQQSKVNGSATATTNTTANGHNATKNDNTTVTEQQSTPVAISGKRTELQTYAQAIEYLKPLEDFVLIKENFRAIGIISHLETVLRKNLNRANPLDTVSEHSNVNNCAEPSILP